MPDAKPAHLTFPQPNRHHLAQLNFATAIADLDDPVMAGFIDALAVVNGIAERSQGFVWRIKDGQEAADEVASRTLASAKRAMGFTLPGDTKLPKL